MMEFLNTLFDYNYFGPVLFAIIAVLIILFFIVLFFGKKEEQERKLEETRKLEELANVNAFKDESEPVDVEVEKEILPVIESQIVDVETTELDTVFSEIDEPIDKDFSSVDEIMQSVEANNEVGPVSDEPVLTPVSELPLITDARPVLSFNEVEVVDVEKEELPLRIEPSIPTNIPRYDFEELANSISKELEEIEKLNNKNMEIDLEKKVDTVNLESSLVEVTPIKEIQNKGSVPIFSSVFVPTPKDEKIEVNNNKIEPAYEESDGGVKNISVPIFDEEPKDNELAPEKIDFSKLRADKPNVATKPVIVLPKHVEMPKKNVEIKNDETNIPDFSEIEGETYNLK